MITIERHPNLDNWLEVKYFGKLLDQFTSLVKAHQFADAEAKKKKTQVVSSYDGFNGNKRHLVE
jgi:hypothetical protein